MKHDGTNKVAERVKNGLDSFGSINIPKSLLLDGNTNYEKVYKALGGRAAGIDVENLGDGTFRFVQGCAHTEVLERYTRLGGTRYRVDQSCTRCGEKISTVTRMGGETASQKVVKRPGHLLKDEPGTGTDSFGGEGSQGEGEGEDGEGGETSDEQEGGGEGEDEGESEGSEGEGEGEGEGESEGDEGEGEGEGGEEGEGEGEEGEGEEGEGEGDGDSEEGEGEGTEGEGEGEGEGGEGESDGDGDSEAPPPSYAEVFGQIWEASLTPEEKRKIYRRVSLMLGEEEGGEAPFPGGKSVEEGERSGSLLVTLNKYGQTEVREIS